VQEQVDKSCVDCDEGRRLGCQTFCCRLLVRLGPDEIEEPTEDGALSKSYLDKDENGLCVHSDAATGLCKIWQKRPHICRHYECNSDFMLQIVLRDGFVNIVETARAARTAYIPKETFIKIPLIKA